MGLTATFTTPFYTGGSTTSLVPSIFDVAIDGRGYMIDTRENPYRFNALGHESIPLIRTQADQSNRPGEQSLNPEDFWRRSVDTWHKGAGQTYLDAADSDAGRFRSSKGIDPWTQGEIRLLHDTAKKYNTATSGLQIVTAGTALYLLDGDVLSYTNDITVGTPSFTSVFGPGFDTAHSVASNGYYVWVVDNQDLYFTVRQSATFDPWLTDALPGSLVRFVKGRLFVVQNRDIFNPGAQGTSAPASFYTHPNPDWVWTDISEGPNAIYMSGYSGDKSAIYQTSFNTTLQALDPPTIAATFPDGEIVRSMQGYLNFLLIGTDKGLRFAELAANGNIQLGDLIRVGPVNCFEPQDRFVYFGWSNPDGDSTGLGRVDLRTLNGTQPAYATDLQATGTQGTVTGVVTFQDLRVFTVSGGGIWAETANYVTEGRIDSGLIGYTLSASKTAVFLETQNRRGIGTYQAALSADEGPFVNSGTAVVTGNASGITSTTVGQASGELFEVRYKLFGNGTTSPALGRFTLRVDPQAPRRDKYQLPLFLFAEIETNRGTVERLSPTQERQRIKQLVRTRRPVSCQIGEESFTGIVEDFQWAPEKPLGFPTFDFEGVLLTSVKTLS